LFHVDAIYNAGLEAQAKVASNPLLAQEEHPTPLVIVDIDRLVLTPTTGRQPLIRMVTIDDAIPFHVLISNDVEVSLMSMHVFLT
jgi:hypothetical protein